MNSALIDMKTILSNSPDEDIQEQIVKNKTNKFDSSGGNKRVEEKASTYQEGRKSKQNSWSSKDKTKSGEYVLSQHSKKLEREEAGDINTAYNVFENLNF